MTGAADAAHQGINSWTERLPHLVGGAAFLWLFQEPIVTLGRDWWNDPEAGHGLLRGVLVLAAISVPMAINGVRIVLTGFLVYFVDPALGDGFMHYTEGWALFVVAFVILGIMTWGLSAGEQWTPGRREATMARGAA